MALRSCGRDATGDYLLAQRADGSVVALDADGEVVAAPFAAALDAGLAAVVAGDAPTTLRSTGCVAQGPGEPALRAVVVATPRFTTPGGGSLLHLVLDDGDTSLAPLLLPTTGAVGFSRVEDDEPVLLGGTVEPTGAEVVRWRITRDGAGYELREEARAAAVAPPASIAYGDVDADGVADTLWGVLDAVQGGLSDVRLQAALACGAGDQPLIGVSGPRLSSSAAVFLSPAADGPADVALGLADRVVFLDTARPR